MYIHFSISACVVSIKSFSRSPRNSIIFQKLKVYFSLCTFSCLYLCKVILHFVDLPFINSCNLQFLRRYSAQTSQKIYIHLRIIELHHPLPEGATLLLKANTILHVDTADRYFNFALIHFKWSIGLLSNNNSLAVQNGYNG